MKLNYFLIDLITIKMESFLIYNLVKYLVDNMDLIINKFCIIKMKLY